MANRKIIMNKAKKIVDKYICKVKPLSLKEKEELKMRIQLAIKEYNRATRSR